MTSYFIDFNWTFQMDREQKRIKTETMRMFKVRWHSIWTVMNSNENRLNALQYEIFECVYLREGSMNNSNHNISLKRPDDQKWLKYKTWTNDSVDELWYCAWTNSINQSNRQAIFVVLLTMIFFPPYQRTVPSVNVR